jgi:hypothetical protein
MAQPQFEVVEDDPPEQIKSDDGGQAAVDILLLLLKPLSQKTIIALGNLFSLLTVVSVFWLSLAIIPKDPSTQQLVGLGGYAAFVIAVNIIVRRK